MTSAGTEFNVDVSSDEESARGETRLSKQS